MNEIDWTDPTAQVSTHFTVADACMLHNWNRLATPADGMDTDKLVILCNKLEEIRSVLGVPMNIHCCFRSTSYNLAQGIMKPTGADVHSFCEAADFDCGSAFTVQEVKDKLEPLLDSLQIRMEKGTTTWVHVDVRIPGPSGRYFTP